MKEKECTYVDKYFSVESNKKEFLKTLGRLFNNGEGHADVIFSSRTAVDILLTNDKKEHLLVFELTDYECELKWINSRTYVEVDLDTIKKLWIIELKNMYTDYKDDYIQYHSNLISNL